jgi:hypothetical protein
MRWPTVAELALLLAGCAATQGSGTPLDLSADFGPPDLSIGCPPTMTSASCNVASQVCSYGATNCVCDTGFWFCNPAACPTDPQQVPSSCTTNGTKCDYGLTALYCVDGKWLSCGDAVGGRCSNPQPENSACCPNDYFMNAMASCGCNAGSACACTNNHVHCAPCD